MAEVELDHLIFAGIKITVRRIDRDVLPDPLVEIGGADRKAIAVQQGRHTHRRLAAIGQSVEPDPMRVHERQLREPVEDTVVLGEYDRKE